MSFTHAIFWQNPLATLSFVSLVLSVLSIWFSRNFWIWGSFALLALVLGFLEGIVDIISLLSLSFFGFCCWYMQGVFGFARTVLWSLILLLGLGLSWHLMPGFHNWAVVKGELLGKSSSPFFLWLNFDKPFVAIFLLGWTVPMLKKRSEWKRMFFYAIPYTIVTLAFLIWVGLEVGLFTWDIKVHRSAFVFLVSSLFFVAIPEGVFVRGFFQEEIFNFLGKGWLAHIAAVLCGALLFMILYAPYVSSMTALFFLFLSGIVYGSIYQATRSVESSIFCHFIFIAINYFFLSYPSI